MTDDPGMKDMLQYLIARDVMHQQQWLAVIEDLGGMTSQLPIPNSFDHSKEMTEFSHTFFSTAVDGIEPPRGRFNEGPALDGKGEYSIKVLRAMGDEPQLAPPIPQAYAQTEQMRDGKARVAAAGRTDSMGIAAGSSAGSLGSEGIGTRLMDTVKSVSDQVTGRGSESGIKR